MYNKRALCNELYLTNVISFGTFDRTIENSAKLFYTQPAYILCRLIIYHPQVIYAHVSLAINTFFNQFHPIDLIIQSVPVCSAINVYFSTK